MSQKSAFENTCDYAIEKFRESLEQTENRRNFSDEFNFLNWKDIIQKLYNFWTKNYSDKLKIYQEENQVENLFYNFRSSMLKIMSKRSDYQTYRAYFEHVIDFFINEIKAHSFNNQEEHKENIGNNHNKLSLNPFVKLDPLGAKLDQSKRSNVYNKQKELFKKVYHYDVENLIRAHSKDGNINDNSTPVTDAAFELSAENELSDINRVPKYTNLCATCGHNIINIMDTDSGKIIKRFNDDLLMNRNKESFNCLAWTILNNLSVLVAAGSHGQIKIIVPKYSSCFARIDAHTMPITSLLFHYKYPNIILSASNDKTIKIWRLTLKAGSTDLDSECSSELLNTIQIGSKSKNENETIFSMCFVANDYLIISTTNDIYGIKLTDNVVFNHDKSQVMEVQEEKMSNEDIIAYMTSQQKTKEDLVAQKVKMIGISSQNVIYEESIVANKLLFYQTYLYASLLNSNLIYIIEILNENENGFENLVLKVVGNLKTCQEKSSELNKISLFIDDTIVYLIKTTNDGVFYLITLNDDLKNFTTSQKYIIPTDYTIKSYSDPARKTSIKNYGLLEKPSVINALCNGKTIVSTTNQNMIVAWKKSKVLADDI
ncbi:DEAD box ATP dependent RNA helicase [Brachionus plicatilis]|uniref:DEAD box ATP dependent RNA helicase n=1 Tax=Brachionus plicatilis TaxID=10195 RepID=A0A3M7S6D8_BRAPC|nr:DEAD box ATP dependent RNA helicase [Brachionus plicatilis]